jgi:hypothetical protein
MKRAVVVLAALALAAYPRGAAPCGSTGRYPASPR